VKVFQAISDFFATLDALLSQRIFRWVAVQARDRLGISQWQLARQLVYGTMASVIILQATALLTMPTNAWGSRVLVLAMLVLVPLALIKWELPKINKLSRSEQGSLTAMIRGSGQRSLLHGWIIGLMISRMLGLDHPSANPVAWLDLASLAMFMASLHVQAAILPPPPPPREKLVLARQTG